MFDEYINTVVKRVENTPIEQMTAFISNEANARGLHAAIGLVTESGELLDAFKKALVYGGRDLDKVNIFEELGDIGFYFALMCDAYGFKIEDILGGNSAKLKTRYTHKFTSEEAHVRDLFQERNVLQSHANKGVEDVSSK